MFDLFWRGKKTFEFSLAAASESDGALQEMRSIFLNPFMQVTVSEVERGLAMRRLEEELVMAKTDAFAIESRGKKPPESLVQRTSRIISRMRCVQGGTHRLYSVKVEVDAAGVDKATAMGAVEKAKAIEGRN
jgi:hypothetical protein